MSIAEMQEVPNSPMPEIERMVEQITNQWREGITPAINYHSQMALLNGIMKNVEQCRYHAALVPDDARDEDKLNAYISTARMLVYEDKINEAVDDYNRCLQIDDEHEMALLEIAHCYTHLKLFAHAEEFFERALQLMPDQATLWEELGLVLSHRQKYEDAITAFVKALQLDELVENIPYYEYLIGLCYANLNDFYRALAHYTKSLDANPSYAPSLTNMATLFYEHEADIKTAVSYLNKAEPIAKAEGNNELLQIIYINLIKLYSQIAEYDLKDFYNDKLLQILGFQASGND
jgi:tetratricopeptide (TPR) repeat protein